MGTVDAGWREKKKGRRGDVVVNRQALGKRRRSATNIQKREEQCGKSFQKILLLWNILCSVRFSVHGACTVQTYVK